jgi:hypothetical protein
VASLNLPASWNAFDITAVSQAALKDLAWATPSHPSGQLHNAFKDVPGARQLSETVDAFLSRLPPATTDAHVSGLPWLWIANPRVPPDPEPNDGLFTREGAGRLRRFTDFMIATKEKHAAEKSATQYNRTISKERTSVVADLCELAAASGVVCGKWMLFPEPGAVNRVWEVVAHATANGELGTVSKVATRSAADPGGERLVCVYTKDFRDKEDVARVLSRLRQLGLASEGPKKLYYKSGQFFYFFSGGWGGAKLD